MNTADISSVSTRELLRFYARILTELARRGVVRSRNAPAGDLAEFLVARAYNGKLAAPSEKSWDVDAAGRKLQVKCRVIDSAAKRTQQFSPFRSWGFDACVFVLLDSTTYEVIRALEIDVSNVESSSRAVAWVAGSRISVAQVQAHPSVKDVTDLVRVAYDSLQ
jgi:hypothetical protein